MNETTPKAGEVTPVTQDGWFNLLTGMAVSSRDKREQDKMCYQHISYEGATAIYQSSWLGARIVDKPVEEMTREGYDLIIEDDEDAATELCEYLEDLNCDAVIVQALTWQRLYGGACVLIGFNDGEADLSKPVNWDKLESVDYLNVFDASEARPVTWQDNPAAKDYGKPVMWAFLPWVLGNERAMTPEDRKDYQSKVDPAQTSSDPVTGQLSIPALRYVHGSRVHAFPGVQISRRYMQTRTNPGIQRGWGDGVLSRCIKLVRDFEGSWDGASYQLREFAQSVFLMSNVAQSLLSDKNGSGSSYIQNRMRVIDMSRSLIRAVVLDKDKEDFKRVDAQMTGVADTLREFSSLIAAAAGMPASILMETQGGGLGASGAGANDQRNWYATVKAKQVKQVKPFLMCVINGIARAADAPDGLTVEDDSHGQEKVTGITIDFRSLYQMTDDELSQIYLRCAQADNIYAGLGTITNEDIARGRFRGGRFKVQLVADLEELKAREEQTKELADTQHEATVTNLQEHGTPLPPAQPPAGKKPGDY